MLGNSKKRSNILDYVGNLEFDMDKHQYEDYNMTNSYDRETNYLSLSENIGNSGSGISNDVSHSAEKRPFTGENDWSYNVDGLHPKFHIQPKNKLKRLKSKKSRCNDVNNKHSLSSQLSTNILKTRLKLGPDGFIMTKKSKHKNKSKVRMCSNTSILNGINSVNSDMSNSYRSSDVPDDLSLHHRTINIGKGCSGSEMESPCAQFLELNPSVMFKCSRCGINDFTSMTLLKEHMISCDGQPSGSVILNSFPIPSTVVCESSQLSSVSRNLKIKRQVLFCSSCRTYYQHYEMYIHMRDTHNVQICLFCTITFSKSQQLWDHLITTHNRTSCTFTTAAQVHAEFKSFYITCCECDSVFSEQDEFDKHKCELNDNLRKSESYCTSCKTSSNEEFTSNVTNGVDATSMLGISNKLTLAIYEKNYNDSFEFPSDDSMKMMPSLDVKESEKPEVEESKMVAFKIEGVSNEKKGDLENEMAARENILQPKEFTKEFLNSDEIEHISDYISQNVESDKTAKPVSNEITSNGVDNNEPEIIDAHNENTAFHLAVEDTEPKSNEDCQPPSGQENALQKTEDRVTNCLDSGGETSTTDMVPQNDEIQQINTVQPTLPVTMALMLDEAVASLNIQTIIKECVRTTYSTCPYCHHATVISVNGSQLASHLRSDHRFMPTKNEDSAEQVIKKLDEAINNLKTIYMNASSTISSVEFGGTFFCLQCAFSTNVFKDLCHHKRKQHHKVMFLCVMCKCNFANYSHLLCHFCPGVYSAEVKHTFTYRCCFCSLIEITSEFRLMVHLRKKHQACDICLTRHENQSELYSHMIKMHKMNHQCYKCNLAYRSRDGISEHLFWKHGTESALCKRCLQKKWPHAYHFCIPASTYVCEECNRIFTKAIALTVHRRAHIGDFPSACKDCDQRFICKKLLSVHSRVVHNIKPKPRETDVKKNVSDAKEVKKSNYPENENGWKKGRKKKKKKGKTDIEKPLLDDLPPLNLSSESNEDSDEEDVVKQPPPSLSPESPVKKSQLYYVLENSAEKIEVPKDKVTEDISKITESVELATEELSTSTVNFRKEDVVICDPIPTEELFPEVTLIERIKNCLVIEHSYCLPDSIFRTEGMVVSKSGNQNSLEVVDLKFSSPKSGLKARDKLRCKLVTPHKHKRAKRDLSTSNSSSNSDSSSGSCGSNCSCNLKSNSNCSLSSSGSEYSTTPDKSKNTKTSADSSRIDSAVTNDGDYSQRENSLNAHESDLDTDILTSDEDFYDEYPTLQSWVANSELPTLPVPSMHISTCESRIISRKRSRDGKGRKRRCAPKITINLGSHINRNDISISVKRVDQKTYPDNFSSYKTIFMGERYDNVGSDLKGSLVPNITVSHNPSFNSSEKSSTMGSDDSKGRRSKRERTKNRFYGYSSSDEASGNDAKKRPFVKQPWKSKLPIVDIRAKKPLIMPLKRPATTTQPVSIARGATHSSLPAHLYRMPSYIMQQQQQQQPQYYSRTATTTNTSDDSDSDNLVINEPSQNERKINTHPNYRLPMGVNDPTTSNYYQRPMGPGQQLSGGSPVLGKSDVKLYCHCRCPYDEVSEMIGCDGENCKIEWFHFECVGIMVPPKGQWYCRECRNSRDSLSSLT